MINALFQNSYFYFIKVWFFWAILFESSQDSFLQTWDLESTPESYDSFHFGQKNRSRTSSKFRNSCQHSLQTTLYFCRAAQRRANNKMLHWTFRRKAMNECSAMFQMTPFYPLSLKSTLPPLEWGHKEAIFVAWNGKWEGGGGGANVASGPKTMTVCEQRVKGGRCKTKNNVTNLNPFGKVK
jgi:hypothetical protein